MVRQDFCTSLDGFHGAYYPNPQGSSSGILLALGNSVDHYLILSCVRWLHGLGCNVMALAPEPGDQGWHSYPLEAFGDAIDFMKRRHNVRIGVAGGSATGSLALLAAAHYPDISLTIAMAPSDFVLEGFLRDGLDGAKERPADGEPMIAFHGRPLPFLPYAYRHPMYWQKLREEAKAGGDLIASRVMFDESEKLHPLTDEEKIPVEKIRGTLILSGAEDDCLWNTCKYIRRIHNRLTEKGGQCRCLCLLYQYGTHFLFPQGLVRHALSLASPLLPTVFRSGREHPLECRQSRIDLEQRIFREIEAWKKREG